MSDIEDQGVDDLLEAAFNDIGAGNDKKEPHRNPATSSSSSHRNQNRGTASPEPQNGSDKKSETSERKRHVSRSASRSRSRSTSTKQKKKKRTRSRSRDERKRRSSRSRDNRRSRDKRRRSPTPSSETDREKERQARRKKKSASRSASRSRSPSRERRDRRDHDRDGGSRRDRRGSRSRSPIRYERSRSRDRGGYGRGGGRDRYDNWRGGGDRNQFRGGGGRGGGRRSPPYRGGFGGGGGGFGRGGGGGRARQSIERARSVRSESPALPPEERDQRTVFCMQLAQSINAKDLEKFFSSVGKVRDVRLIVDSKTRRSKGIAYVEFRELEAVPLALGLHGQKLKNCPMNIQPTHAEKNRAAMAAAGAVQKGPMRLYVGSLHFNITEDMLKDIFEPFGKLDSVQLMMDPESGRSRGYAFITFRDAQDAKRAMEQLNGFELAGRAMKIGHVTDRSENAGQNSLDNDDMDRAGFDLGPTGRLQLMAKLAEGTGMKIPHATVAPPPAPVGEDANSQMRSGK